MIELYHLGTFRALAQSINWRIGIFDVFGRNAFERTGIIVPDGYYLYVSCDTDNVTATAYGIKEQV